MTILQTLITKKDPNLKIEEDKTADSQKEIEVKSQKHNNVSEKEKSYRNLLGLKSKGAIDVKILEKNYKERASNYTDSRLQEMNAGKRRQALEKRETGASQTIPLRFT